MPGGARIRALTADEEADVKYVLMIYANPTSWGHPVHRRAAEAAAMPPARLAEMDQQFESVMTEIFESGELVGGEALADPMASRTVRVRDGVPAVTDGPYVETKEHLAGYFIVDCVDIDRATEIAARFPDAEFWAVEIRPIATDDEPPSDTAASDGAGQEDSEANR